jgi:hypothetical protein
VTAIEAVPAPAGSLPTAAWTRYQHTLSPLLAALQGACQGRVRTVDTQLIWEKHTHEQGRHTVSDEHRGTHQSSIQHTTHYYAMLPTLTPLPLQAKPHPGRELAKRNTVFVVLVA